MQSNDAIVNPVKPPELPEIGKIAVMAAIRYDVDLLCRLFRFDKDDFQRLFVSRLYTGGSPTGGFSVTGPFIGAPYATMLLEILIAAGARKIIFLGWCGAVSPEVKIGDIILPTAAVIDEGTSGGYAAAAGGRSQPSSSLVATIRQVMDKRGLDYHAGTIWSTDAVYRETRQKVEAYQHNGILAVEMEFSALCTVAQFRRVEVGSILVVSDELASFNWRPGFKNDRFKNARKTACQVVQELCQTVSIPQS